MSTSFVPAWNRLGVTVFAYEASQRIGQTSAFLSVFSVGRGTRGEVPSYFSAEKSSLVLFSGYGAGGVGGAGFRSSCISLNNSSRSIFLLL